MEVAKELTVAESRNQPLFIVAIYTPVSCLIFNSLSLSELRHRHRHEPFQVAKASADVMKRNL